MHGPQKRHYIQLNLATNTVCCTWDHCFAHTKAMTTVWESVNTRNSSIMNGYILKLGKKQRYAQYHFHVSDYTVYIEQTTFRQLLSIAANDVLTTRLNVFQTGIIIRTSIFSRILALKHNIWCENKRRSDSTNPWPMDPKTSSLCYPLHHSGQHLLRYTN